MVATSIDALLELAGPELIRSHLNDVDLTIAYGL